MDLDRHYIEPRLAAIYDAENAGRTDIDFYIALAAELGAGDVVDVVDVGCGTGVLAADLAARGHRTTGVDPARAMLAVARSRPGGERVTWLEGDATALDAAAADLAIMTGHVAQVFLTDADWGAALAAIHRALRPGCRLAFESRNPAAEGWRRWTKANSFGTFRAQAGEAFDSWVEVTGVEPGFVRFEGHTVFASSGEDVVVPSSLRFRTWAELETSLIGAGFEFETVYGDWDRGPVTEASPELIITARRPG